MAKRRNEENNTALFAALGGAALLLVGAIVGMKFLSHPPPPPPPPQQPAAVLPINTPVLYRGMLDEDAKKYGVSPTTPEEIGKPLSDRVELDAPRTLKPGGQLDTERLHLAASVVKEWAKTEGGQGFRYDHFILSITNKSSDAIAYRVDTSLLSPEKCRSQGAISHNGVALLAGEKSERTECLYHPGMTVTVKRIETITLPPIGYYYVSRLLPSQLGLEARTSAGHQPPKDVTLCKYVPWRDIAAAGATWADAIDFYARHNCDEYTFYRGYRMRTAPGPLPAAADNAAAAPGTAAADVGDGG